MAPLAELLDAVTTYRPDDSLASALATSGDMPRFLAMESFCVSICAMSVPASSTPWHIDNPHWLQGTPLIMSPRLLGWLAKCLHQAQGRENQQTQRHLWDGSISTK